MDVRVLGCYGAQLPGFNATSFLLNGHLLVDAGTVTSVLPLEEQKKIDYILVTHAHIDHVRDIMLLTDNLVMNARRGRPVQLVSTPGIIQTLRKHYFNGIVWPDFSRIPDKENPIIQFTPLPSEEKCPLGEFFVTAFPVSHTVETVGYLIEYGGGSVVFTGDTGPTVRLWEVVRRQKDVKAIFIETSFHDAMKGMAVLSGHLTPSSLAGELKKLGDQTPDIYIYHMKTLLDLDLIREGIGRIGYKSIRILEDGDVITFGS